MHAMVCDGPPRSDAARRSREPSFGEPTTPTPEMEAEMGPKPVAAITCEVNSKGFLVAVEQHVSDRVALARAVDRNQA
jgi:hypothetical protein